MIIMYQLLSERELNTSLIQFSNNCHGSVCEQQRNKDWHTITATQIVIFLLFIFGIFFAIIIYCRSCSRSSQTRYSGNSASRNELNDDRRNSDAAECESRQRPPTYSEACNAPPLYGTPFNRASMLEAPPVYPDTPKLSDRVSHQITQAFPVSCHI